jgi:hypothetical protein
MALIDSRCPSCRTHYHIDTSLLGKAIRCPTCRAVFVVKDDRDEPPEATSGDQ